MKEGNVFIRIMIILAGFVLQLSWCRTVGNKLLLISFDGFRWDYYINYETPNLDYLARTGIHAPNGIRTTFTTKTFPAHYTIVTGLYQESHGIIDNHMYDPVFNESFHYKNKQFNAKWWDGGEPIWITARRQGRRVGVYFWQGSEVKLKNLRPNFYFKYDSKVRFKTRIETAVTWLANDEVDMALVYFNQPDNIGHKSGALSEDVRKTVESLDKLVGFLLQKIKGSNLEGRLNLVITSDHGMTNLTNHLIVLEEYVNLKDEIKLIPVGGPVAGILPQENKLDVVYNKLKNAHPNMTVYKKEEIPERWHYRHNRRIMPIIAVADPGYLILKKYQPINLIAHHGYDNNLKSMNPIFFAWGPDFRKNYTTDIFDIVHIYPLMCYLLGIEPSPNNGSLNEIQHLLKENYCNTEKGPTCTK